MTGKIVGKFVCPVSAEKTGEAESLFVESAYRSDNIGTALVARGITRMGSTVAVQKRVSKGDGNEAARAIYRNFGFLFAHDRAWTNTGS